MWTDGSTASNFGCIPHRDVATAVGHPIEHLLAAEQYIFDWLLRRSSLFVTRAEYKAARATTHLLFRTTDARDDDDSLIDLDLADPGGVIDNTAQAPDTYGYAPPPLLTRRRS